MLNSLFYTFSTIAQTLAGAIALLGAFVLYRLQSLNSEIDSDSSQIATVLESVHGETVKELYRSGQHRKLLELAAATELPINFYQVTKERARLSLLLDRRDSLFASFRLSLYLTVGLITVSILALSITPKLADLRLGVLTLFIGIGWFAGCMASYVSLLHQALKSESA